MLRFLVMVYSIIRAKLNPIRFPDKNHPVWKEVLGYDMNQFSEWVNSFSYKSDLLFGLIDRTPSFEEFIDPDLKHSRDCDAFARMWLIWGMMKGYSAYEYIVGNNGIPMRAHMITILKKDDKYWLCDYKPYGPFSSEKNCKVKLCNIWPDYDFGNLIFQKKKFL